MKAMMLLLMLAVAALSGPVDQSTKTLKSIVDLVNKYNGSSPMDSSVEDVSPLSEGSNKCKAKFFCKVYQIMKKPELSYIKKQEVARNLKVFIDMKEFKCEVRPKKNTSDVNTIQISDALKHLVSCIQHSLLTASRP